MPQSQGHLFVIAQLGRVAASLPSYRACDVVLACRHAHRPQVRVLTWRELLAVTRNPADVAGRTLVFCWVGVVVGLIFYSLGTYFESLR